MDNSIKRGHSWGTPRMKVKRDRWEAIYSNFRLNVGIWNVNHMNKFVSISKLLQSRNDSIPRILSKVLRKSKYIMQKDCYSIYWTHQLCNK